MTSDDLKVEALHWLRFVKRWSKVCTEVSTAYGLADVFGMGPKATVEIETKISKSDLRRDFTHKLKKHQYYKDAAGKFVPNYFYFWLPMSIGEEAVKLVQEHNPRYGVVGLDGNYLTATVLHRAQKLHDRVPDERVLHVVEMRMSSEIAGLHRVNNELQHTVFAAVKNLTKDIVSRFDGLAGSENGTLTDILEDA